jgi:hypothetical protein
VRVCQKREERITGNKFDNAVFCGIFEG